MNRSLTLASTGFERKPSQARLAERASPALLAPRDWPLQVMARVLIHLLFLRPLVRVLFRVRVEGSSRLASVKQFILVANHNSHLDTVMLYLALPIARIAAVRPVAARDYFGKKPLVFAVVNFLFRPIWIDRDSRGETAVERMVEAIDEGESIIVFPEGSRGLPGQIGRFRSGVGRLLERRPGVAVVPAHLEGTERSLPRGATFPRFVAHRVIVGSPRFFSGAPREVASSLRDAVEALGASLPSRTAGVAPPPRHPLRIAVIGIDGCGKSTVSRQLARELSQASTIWLVSDTLEVYERGLRVSRPRPWLEGVRQWIGSRAKQARSLAAYKIPKLIELLLRDTVARQIERRGDADVIVMDGSPLINLLAWASLYRERGFDAAACTEAMAVMTSRCGAAAIDGSVLARFPELAALARLRLNRLQAPHAAFLLDLGPDLAMRRIGARNEQRQVHESEAHLSKLRAAYLTVHRILERHPRIAACRLDAALGIDALLGETLRMTTEMRSQCHA